MSLPAVANVGDALEATRTLLLPFDRGRWLRLTAISLLVGGAGGVGSGFQGGGPPGDVGVAGPGVDVGPGPGDVPALVVALVVVGLLVAAVLLFASSVMEFVLVEALATESVAVRAPFRAHLGDGAELFAFRLALLVAGLLFVVLPLMVVVFGFFGPGTGLAAPLALLVAIPLVLVGVLVLGVVHGFTTVFVVPVMYEADCGVVAGWRRFFHVIRADPVEYLVYLVLSVLLGMVGGVAIAVVVGIAAVVVLLPLGIVGLVAVLTGGLSPLALLVVVPVALLAGGILLVTYAAASVPVLVYLRYYALLELGDTSSYDLVADRRAAIRGS